jgi:hypothetical protein
MDQEILLDNSKVKGLIYLITNKETKKQYVGQTLTHRKNRGKYRPFGIEGRFQDHLSEAICNTKKKQCSYLNNAIRHYGKDAFEVYLVTECSKEDLDINEQKYIEEYKTLYPYGYNLTRGGKTTQHAIIEEGDISKTEVNPTGKRGGCSMRSEKTRNKISSQLKKVLGTQENCKRQMNVTKEQHRQQKFERFKNEKINLENLDLYLYIKHAKGIPFVVVKVNNIETTFVGKYKTLEELREEARMFLREVGQLNCDASKLTGNP